jgi:hypothetical protein
MTEKNSGQILSSKCNSSTRVLVRKSYETKKVVSLRNVLLKKDSSSRLLVIGNYGSNSRQLLQINTNNVIGELEHLE